MTLPLATILVADDHVPTLETWKTILEASKFEVLLAGNGRHAFHLAHEKEPDLIVSDIDMPRLNGFELLTQLKAIQKTEHIPVIICSGTTDVTSKYLALVLGAAAYFEKPLREQQLLDIIHEVLDLTTLPISV